MTSTLGRVVELPGARAPPHAPAQPMSRAAADLSASVDPFTDEQAGVVDDWGRDPGLVRSVDRRSQAALGRHRRRRPAPPAPQGRADRRQRPALGAGADLRGVGAQRGGRPTGPVRRPARHRPGRAAAAPDRRPARPPRRSRRRARRRPARGHGRRAQRTAAQGRDASTTRSSAGPWPPGVQVFPAATSSNPIGRAARLEIGTPSRSPRRRRGPLERARTRRSGRAATSSCCSPRWATSARARRSTGSRSPASEAPDDLRPQHRRHPHPLPQSPVGRRRADPVHPGPRRRQERLEPAASRHRSLVPRHRARQPGRRSQRQAARHLLARADGRRRDRRARPCRRGDGPRRRRVDGRCDQPDHRGEVPRADPLAHPGLHGRAGTTRGARSCWRAGATRRSNVGSARWAKTPPAG